MADLSLLKGLTVGLLRYSLSKPRPIRLIATEQVLHKKPWTQVKLSASDTRRSKDPIDRNLYLVSLPFPPFFSCCCNTMLLLLFLSPWSSCASILALSGRVEILDKISIPVLNQDSAPCVNHSFLHMSRKCSYKIIKERYKVKEEPHWFFWYL